LRDVSLLTCVAPGITLAARPMLLVEPKVENWKLA
jgi:hypothetical protein